MDKYLDVACPACAQQPGEPCKSRGAFGDKLLDYVHSARIEASAFCAAPGEAKMSGAPIDEAFASVVDQML